MPARKLKAYLGQQHVAYTVIPHRPTWSAQQTAASTHIPGQLIAKTVMVKIDGKMALAVLPAPKHVDFARLQTMLGADTVELAEEHEFGKLFPDCEVGAMPPFGNLYGMQVFVETSLAEDVVIAFPAGTHDELIEMSYSDFSRLVRPVVIDFAHRRVRVTA